MRTLGELERETALSVGHLSVLRGRGGRKSSWQVPKAMHPRGNREEGLRFGIRGDDHQMAPEHRQSLSAAPWLHLQSEMGQEISLTEPHGQAQR